MTHNEARATMALLVLLLAAVPFRAAAEGGRKTRAKAAFTAGLKLLSDDKPGKARKQFLRAVSLFPNHRIDVNIAITYERQKNGPRAAEHYRRYLARAKDNEKAKIRQVKRALRAVKKDISEVILRCDEPGGEVAINGKARGTTPLSAPIFLKPGDYTVVVAKKGRKTYSRDVTLAAGEGIRLEVPLSEDGASASAGRSLLDPGDWDPWLSNRQSDASFATATDKKQVNTPIYKKWWLWTAVGVVVVGAATAAVLATQTGGSDRLPQSSAGSISFK